MSEDCIFVTFKGSRTSRDFFFTQNELIGVLTEKDCLLCGTKGIFKHNSCQFSSSKDQAFIGKQKRQKGKLAV
jgi:hypothetical protein